MITNYITSLWTFKERFNDILDEGGSYEYVVDEEIPPHPVPLPQGARELKRHAVSAPASAPAVYGKWWRIFKGYLFFNILKMTSKLSC